jgi:hypothetical protein
VSSAKQNFNKFLGSPLLTQSAFGEIGRGGGGIRKNDLIVAVLSPRTPQLKQIPVAPNKA